MMESRVKNDKVMQPIFDLKQDIEFRVKWLNGSNPVVLKSDNVST